MDEIIEQIMKKQARDNRYALKGEFGLDWEDFLYFIVRIDNEEQKKNLQEGCDSCIIDLMKSFPTRNYLESHVLMSLISYLKYDRKDKEIFLYHLVNRAALLVFKENNYTNEELKAMMEKYKYDFDNLTRLSRSDLNLRDNILYTIIMLNVLSYRIVATEIPGAYTNIRINNGDFSTILINMSQNKT